MTNVENTTTIDDTDQADEALEPVATVAPRVLAVMSAAPRPHRKESPAVAAVRLGISDVELELAQRVTGAKCCEIGYVGMVAEGVLIGTFPQSLVLKCTIDGELYLVAPAAAFKGTKLPVWAGVPRGAASQLDEDVVDRG